MYVSVRWYTVLEMLNWIFSLIWRNSHGEWILVGWWHRTIQTSSDDDILNIMNKYIKNNGHYLVKLYVQICKKYTWCVFVSESLHMHRDEKPTRCHWMVYCTYNMLNMFRVLLCPSSGARDYVLLPPTLCSALVAGCWRSGAGRPAMRSGWGMLLEQHPSSRTHSLLPCT